MVRDKQLWVINLKRVKVKPYASGSLPLTMCLVCDLGLKFYVLKFLLREGSDRRITVNQNEIFFWRIFRVPVALTPTVTWLMWMSPKQNGKCDWAHGSCKIKEKNGVIIKGKRKSHGNIVSLTWFWGERKRLVDLQTNRTLFYSTIQKTVIYYNNWKHSPGGALPR